MVMTGMRDQITTVLLIINYRKASQFTVFTLTYLNSEHILKAFGSCTGTLIHSIYVKHRIVPPFMTFSQNPCQLPIIVALTWRAPQGVHNQWCCQSLLTESPGRQGHGMSHSVLPLPDQRSASEQTSIYGPTHRQRHTNTAMTASSTGCTLDL